jgi:hypothetical protein
VLFRFSRFKGRGNITSEFMFPAREGGKWEQRNALRSYYCLLKRLALPQSGDVVRLSIILGHSEIGTRMKYLHLLTDDLQRPRQRLSILNRLR